MSEQQLADDFLADLSRLWEYHITKYLFKQYCEEEGRVGLLVYETEALSDEYFMPFPKDKDQLFNLSKRFVFNEEFVFDKTKLEEKYSFTYKEIIPISKVGPINSIETTVLRKSDNKLLGKAVSLSVSLTSQIESLIGSPKSGKKIEYYPAGYDGRGLSSSGKLHLGLIKEIFYRR